MSFYKQNPLSLSKQNSYHCLSKTQIMYHHILGPDHDTGTIALSYHMTGDSMWGALPTTGVAALAGGRLLCWHNLSKPSQFLCISDGARPLLLQMTSQHQIIIRWAIHHPMSQHPIIVRWAIHHFFTTSGWHWETCSKMKCPKTMKLALNGVQVAPFGLKLCQNDAPDLRIIFQTLLGPKTSLNK